MNENILHAFSDGKNNSVNYLKIKGLTRDEKEHYFELNNEKLENLKGFSGKLIKINPSEYEYEGLMRQTIKMLFVNKGEYYQLDISYNSISRSMLNTILGYLEEQKQNGISKGKLDLYISLYVNKKGYKQISVYINNYRPRWKYGIEEQNKMINVIEKKNGDKIREFDDFDEKIKSELIHISNYILVDDFIPETQEEQIENKEIDFKESDKKFSIGTKKEEEISIEDLPF